MFLLSKRSVLSRGSWCTMLLEELGWIVAAVVILWVGLMLTDTLK